MPAKLTPPDDAPLPWTVDDAHDVLDGNGNIVELGATFPRNLPLANYIASVANASPELETAIEQWAADYATATEEAVRIHGVMHARIAALEQENATISGLQCRIRRLEDLLVEAASIVREMAPGNTVLLDDIDKETP